MTEPGGLNPITLDKIKKYLLYILSSKKSFAVETFGSRAKNTYKKYSDLDLWIESTPALSEKEISVIREYFEESDLAIKIDIVTPEICLPAYVSQIQNEKKLWFEKNRTE